MNNFECFPIVFDNNAPELHIVISNLLDNQQIPINIITNKNDPMFKELEKTLPLDFNVKFFVVVIVYLQKFEV